MESSRSARAAITHSCAPTGDDVPYFARNLVTMATIHVVNDQSPAHWIRFPSCLLLCSLLLPTCISSFCVYCQGHTTDRHLTTYSKHLMLPRKLSPLLPRACHVLRSSFCQLIMATLKFYKHLLIDYDRHLTTYTEQFFSCFLLLQPSGPCFYLPPYSWRLPASYPDTVIGSIDLLASSDSPVYLHPSAVFFYPVYLTMNYATLRPLLSTCYSKKILSAIFSADPLYCYLSLGDTLLLSIHTHNDTTQRHSYTNLCWTTTTTQLNDTSCPCTTKTFGHYKTSKVEMNATANTTSTMTQAT